MSQTITGKSKKSVLRPKPEKKIKIPLVLTFVCKGCGKIIKSHLPSSIINETCVDCREEILGKRLANN